MNMHEMYEKRDRLRGELDQLKAAYAITPDAGTLERLGNLKRGVQSVEKDIIHGLAGNPENRDVERGDHGEALSDGFGNPLKGRTRRDNSPGGEARSEALRAIEQHGDELTPKAGDRLTEVIDRDKFGLDAAYIAAISAPAYERAFSKKLSGVNGAEDVLEADESAAMLAVGRAMSARAMAVGEGKLGGYAVPLTIDPTVLLTNDGAINPLRDLATTTTINTTHWRGVSSAGVKAVFAAEATESEDGSPELGAPEITPERASIWVPFSIEVGQDWGGLSGELQKLFADAKSVKEAETFSIGEGKNNIPEGLITGATKLVETATKEVVKIADVYSLQEALAPRWQPKATWLAANAVANQIHRFVAQGDTSNARIMSDARDEILGKPFREVSTMSVKSTTKKERVLAYGDVASAFRIVDRIGMSVELVPLVFGEEGAPSGQRGLYAWFRVGSKVIVPEAVQVLAVKE